MAQQDVAVKQDNLMRAQGKSMYGVILKMVKGEIPYDQEAVDAAIAQLEGKRAHDPRLPLRQIPRKTSVNANYGASQKIWQNKADFEFKGPAVAKAIADVKGTIKDVASLKVAFDTIQDKCTDCHETYRLKLK